MASDDADPGTSPPSVPAAGTQANDAGGPRDERDPFAPIEASSRGAHLLAGLGLVCGILAAFAGVSVVAGPVGMGLGLTAHVKGSRLGMPAAIVAGVGTVVGMTLTFLLR